MRLLRLRLNGFKSFVDPTDLPIRDGLTGVVGPNGCGKSNLLEAMRWVMGETRPTAMRGEGMEDVIFAGSASRPARHFAEVALLIDNSERLAPQGFNDADQIEITRRITREAGSAFRLNGRELRARDVQILFADAATGAQSPALVRQGQIGELINARPRNRRRVLEDAAGIAGLYQRRHEAELRLSAAETNLARVEDVLEQLAQQLAALARQARAAARYREIGAALRRAEAMAAWRRWAEADASRARAADALAEATRAVGAAAGRALGAARTRETCEAALPAARDEAAIAGALRQRLEQEHAILADRQAAAQAAGAALEARAVQIERDAEREAELLRDAAETVAALATEEATLAAEGEGHEARLAELAAAALLAGTTLGGAEEALSRATGDAARIAARHQSARRLVEEISATMARAGADAARAAEAAQAADSALARAEAIRAEADAEALGAAEAARAADAHLAAAEAARADLQTREGTARAARAATEGEARALGAEAQALAALIARESRAGAQVLDRLTVAPGYERALGAALGDDLRSPLAEAPGQSGWVAPPDAPPPDALALPEGVEPLAPHVEAPPALARRLAHVGIAEADAAARLQARLAPGQRLVSRAGDLWRWDGFRLLAGDAPSAAALRLEQVNRLASLRRDLEEANARATGARQAHERLGAELQAASDADRTAREARRAADQALAAAGRTRAEADAARAVAAGRLEAARLAEARLGAEHAEAAARLAEAEAQLAALPAPDGADAAIAALRAEVEAGRSAMLAARGRHDEAQREGERRARRRAEIARESLQWRERRAAAERRAGELAAEAARLGAERAAAAAEPARLAAEAERVQAARTTAAARAARATDALGAAEARLREAQAAERRAEAEAAEAREARAGALARAEAADAAEAEARGRIAEMTDDGEGNSTGAPEALLARIGAEAAAIPEAATLEEDIARLRRARDGLGAVNLRAEGDAREIEAEHATLGQEKADLDAAIRTLRGAIGGLNREGRERLLTAFEQVNANFTTLFTHLFGGGSARLVLVESDDPLEAGLEIMCQPPGKKLATLSLLSGGEQTLTALALIFAVFLANPAPICVLDEVDAPLDDANVTRFCDLLDEMARRTETRFLVITHHAVTMARMDRLFGVTMAEQGVSQLVSVDLRAAEALVA